MHRQAYSEQNTTLGVEHLHRNRERTRRSKFITKRSTPHIPSELLFGIEAHAFYTKIKPL